MARNNRQQDSGSSRSTLDGAGPLHVRILKVGLERLAAAGARGLAGSDGVQKAVDFLKSQIDKVGGTGMGDALFDSEAFKVIAAGGIQLPGFFFRPVLAQMLRIDEDLADEIVQEGVDKAILAFLDETGKAAKGKTPAEQNAIIRASAASLPDKVQQLLRAANTEGLKPVCYDPDTGLAHKQACEVVKNRSGIVRKDDAGNDLTLLAAKKLGGRMTSECVCAGLLMDPAGTLDEALMRLDGDERRAFDAYLASQFDVRIDILKKGSVARDITTAKILLVLKTTDPRMKRERLLLLVRADGPKAAKSPLERATDYAQKGLDVLTDSVKRDDFNESTKAGAAGYRKVNSVLDRLIGK